MQQAKYGRDPVSCSPGYLARLVLVCLFPVQAMGGTYTVTGILHTPAGPNALANDVPARYIKVIVMDQDPFGPDDIKGTGYTGTIGEFSVTFQASESPDVYINVQYVGTGVSGRLVEVRQACSDPSPILQDNVEDDVHPNIPEGTWGLGTLHLDSTRANIVSQIGDAVRFLQNTYPTWVMPEDLNAEGRTTAGSSYVTGDGACVSIALDDYNNPGVGGAAFSDMHHETYHWVAYRAYGNRWAFPNCAPQQHSYDTESCEGFAIDEGAAEYFAMVSFTPPDQMNLPPLPTDWRGSDGTGHDHSGEIVEGGCARAWWSTGDVPGVLQVFLNDAPDSMKEFKDAYAVHQGTTATTVQTFLDQCAANGIVYTRGKISGFSPGDPPDTTPPSSGNFKMIDQLAFLRGEVLVGVSELTKMELRLATYSAPVPADQKDLGVKVAVPGLNEADTAGFGFIGAVALGADLIWNTTAHADADYDLIARLRSGHHWVDTFAPDFTGDANPPTDTNEKWLKTLQTWYNQDSVPDNDDEGKVIVDNTAPVVSNFKPQ